jgi:hypothetical protein
MRAIITVLAGLVFVVPAQAEKLIWKREAFPSNCKEIKLENPSHTNFDIVLFQCPTKLGPPMWQIFQDSSRQSIGFGIKMNMPHLAAELTRGNWPLEWGGVIQGGKFVPKVAIARFKFSTRDGHVTALSAYRLLPDGTSCHIETDGLTKNENSRVRRMAEDSSSPCVEDDGFIK